MTAEERARLICSEFAVVERRHWFGLLANEFRLALAEEREACAQIALATNDCCEYANDGCHVGDLCPIAKKIRARA